MAVRCWILLIAVPILVPVLLQLLLLRVLVLPAAFPPAPLLRVQVAVPSAAQFLWQRRSNLAYRASPARLLIRGAN